MIGSSSGRRKHWIRPWVKAAIGWAVFRLGLHRAIRSRLGTIVVFHRIDDRYPQDPITIGRDEFQRFVEFFARYFEVVPLSTMLDRIEAGRDLRGALSVTLDDGYRDNASVAGPVLAGHGISACFFVTADFVATDQIPFWDQQAGIASEWMTWDDVRALRKSGHEIGAHTLTHINLGKAAPAEARAELVGSRERLERELGEPVTLFAYPFGGREQMAESNRAVVKDVGFRCCLEAAGGMVGAGVDLHRLNRVVISRWFVSPYQFGFEYLFGKLHKSAP